MTIQRLKFVAASSLFVLIVVADLAAENEWTGWLGPHRNGWVDGFEAPSPWPENLHRVWQRDVGTGYGTPLVSADRIYQHARQDEEEVLWCLDRDTGEVIWRKGIKTPFKMGGGGEFHGKGPKSNPALADGRVFTYGITGVLTAFDSSSGDLLWQKDYSSQFEKPHPYWGATTSPIVDSGMVFIHFGGDDEGLLVASDVKTGQPIWKLGKDGAAYASPLIAEWEGIRQLVEWNHNALIGVDIKTGNRLWDYPFPHVGTNQNMPSPALHQGRILVGGENRGIRSVEPKLKDGSWTAHERWYQKKLALDMSSAIVNGNRLYGFSHYQMGQLFCLDTDSGEIIWRGPGRAGDNATFLAIPDHIISLIDDGELQIVSTKGDQYTKLASYRVSEQPTWAAPVLLDDGFLIKDQTRLLFWAFDSPRSTASTR